jgi:hypothetical protein
MLDSQPSDQRQPIQRLLFVADAAVADADELPPPVRAIIGRAAKVYVVTPTLPGRLAWLADEVDRCRHVADERLDTVLGHMHSIGANARGDALRGSVLTVLGDAVDTFKPDHIVLALRSAEHANWQEHRLIEHVEQRFRLPVTSYAVDLHGHTSRAEGPLLLCYDGSADAHNAIEQAGALFEGSDAIVVTAWQPAVGLGNFAWAGEGAPMVDFFELDRAAAENGGRIAAEGARIAQEAGLRAEPVAVPAAGPRMGDDHRGRRPASRGRDRDGIARAHRCAFDAARKRVQRHRAPRRAAHAGHSSLRDDLEDRPRRRSCRPRP